MQVVDYVLLAAIATSTVIGVMRGFFREALSLLTWIVAIWLAWEFSTITEPLLRDSLAQPSARLWVGRFIVFIGILLLGALLGWGMSRLVRHSGLSGIDRVLGMGFGLGRGILIMGLLVMLGQVMEMEQEPWWQGSRLVPYGLQVAEEIRDFLEGGLVEQIPLEPPDINLPAAQDSGAP